MPLLFIFRGVDSTKMYFWYICLSQHKNHCLWLWKWKINKFKCFFSFQHSAVGKCSFPQMLFFFYRTAFFSNSFFSQFLFSSCFLYFSVCLLIIFFFFFFFYIYNTKYYIYGNINILYIFILPSLYYFLSFFLLVFLLPFLFVSSLFYLLFLFKNWWMWLI